MTNRPIDRVRAEILRTPDEMDATVEPPRFDEARDHLRLAVERIERAGIPAETLHAVLMSETLPRLIDEHDALHRPRAITEFCLDGARSCVYQVQMIPAVAL